MVKAMAIIILMVLVYLFYPFWDLYTRPDPFAAAREPAGTGFWTRNGCEQAAEAQNAAEYRCRKRVNFNRFLGASGRYGQGHRPE